MQGQRLFVAFSKPPTKLLDSNSLFLNYLPENITEEKILTAINDFNVFYFWNIIEKLHKNLLLIFKESKSERGEIILW